MQTPGFGIAKSKPKILFYLKRMLVKCFFINLFGKYICLVSFLRVRNPFICVIGTRGPKKNPPFLGQPEQLHSLFKAAQVCTDLFCPSCVVYSYTCTFIVAICGSPPKKNPSYPGLLDSYIPNSKLDTLYIALSSS